MGSDSSIDLYTFTTAPANGVKVSAIGADENFEATISEFATISGGSTSSETTTFVLTNDMISGKEMYIDDADGTATLKFKTDGTYSEVFDDTKSDGDKGTCTGAWSISSNFLNINQTCSDSSDSEFVTLIFNEQPSAGVTFGVTVNSVDDGDTTITSISNIEEASTGGNTDTSVFTLATNMLDNKVLYFTDSGFTSLTFGAYDSNITAGSFYEYTQDTGDTPIKCYGDWALDSSTANTIVIDNMCTGDINYSTMYITFTSEPEAGTIVTYIDGEDTGTSPISAIGNSFIADKTLVFSDNEGSITSIFGGHGAYSETGIDDYSCSGYWADLGNNKIGVTCQDNGTTELPDGIIDANSNEITMQFTSTPLKANDVVTMSDADGSFEMNINSISAIQY